MLSPKLLSISVLFSLPMTLLAQSLSQVLGSTSSVSSLASVLEGHPELTQSLSNARNITILAPSNDAFAALMNSSAGMAALSDNTTVAALLSYHVLSGTYRANGITDRPQFLPTMLTDKRFANFTGDGKQVVEAVSVNNNATIYSGLKMNSSVSTADVTFDGGIIHIINNVLTLPMNVSSTAIAANLTAAAGALMSADMVNTIDTAQSLTIFVPNNGAFQAIGNLLPGLSKEDLASILTYHVVPGTVAFSPSLTDDRKLRTLQGGEVTITVDDGATFVNGARVVLADVITSNGVVHVIDGVLNPNNADDDPETDDATQSAAFPSATRVNDVPFTSGVPTVTGTTTVPSSSSTGSAGEGSAASSLRGNIAAGAVMGAAIIFALAIVA